MATFPSAGRSKDDVLGALEALAAHDADFEAGRTFGLIYHLSDPEASATIQAAHDRYVWYNALNPAVFPSLRTMTADVVDISAHLLSGGLVGAAPQPALAGFLASGGTESILMGVKAAKVAGKRKKGVEHGNVVLASTAHAAFAKGCDYFGLEQRRVDVDQHFRACPDAMADACDDDTVLIVGSAPQYPQGIIDPIPPLGQIALDRDINLHVDSCIGGFVLPFLEVLGHVDTGLFPWDFRVPGVTTISADLHKYAYVPKGASVILHRDKVSRRDQTFMFDGWLGGFYGSSGVLGTKPGGPIAAAWASLQVLGLDGFTKAADEAFIARTRLEAGVRATPGLTVLGQPQSTLCAITADPAHAGTPVDVFALGDALFAAGWHLDRQTPPDSLHATCTPVQGGAVMDEFLAALRATVEELAGERTDDRSTTYGAVE